TGRRLLGGRHDPESTRPGTAGTGVSVLLDDLDLLLGHHAVHDAEGAQRGVVRVGGGDKDVVRLGPGGQGDVGAGRVGLGRGVGVVDHHGLLVPVPHLVPDLDLLGRVELVERGRARGVAHRDEPFGAVRAGRTGDDAARLVRVV